MAGVEQRSTQIEEVEAEVVDRLQEGPVKVASPMVGQATVRAGGQPPDGRLHPFYLQERLPQRFTAGHATNQKAVPDPA